MTQDQAMLGANSKWVMNLRTLGKSGIAKEGKGKKLVNRGTPMIVVGYPEN